MNIIQNLVDPSKYNIKSPYSMTPEFIVMHNTANDASARNEISYMRNNNNQVSFHFAVDEKEVVQGLPLNRNGWHSGDGGSGQGNRYGIAIEVCRSTGNLEVFKKCEANAVKLVAKLLKERNWGIDRVRKHQDFDNKNCPHKTIELGWQRFLDLIKVEMNISSQVKTNEQIADEVINGVWGNGNARETALTNAGYNYDAIQKLVNKKFTGKPPVIEIKDFNAVANQVIRGDFGNGQARIDNLKRAGYTSDEIIKIQNIVNSKY